MITWLQATVGCGCLMLGAALVPQIVGTARQNGPAPVAVAKNCANAQLAAMLADADELQLAVAAGSGIPRERRSVYRKMAHAAVACARPGTRVAVRPITEHAIIEIPIFDRTVPARVGENEYNDVHYAYEMRIFLKDADEALDRLASIGARDRGADPLGSLIAASRDITSGKRALVVLICNGWQQTRQLNTFVYRADPARYASTALRFLERNQTPLQLGGARIVIAGITAGDPGLDATDAQLEGVCVFWSRVVQSGHGIIRCGSSLPGFSDPRALGNAGPTPVLKIALRPRQ